MSKDSLAPLRRYSAPITEKLEALLLALRAEFPAELSAQGEWVFTEMVNYVRRPSKRLRGSLAAYTYDTVKGVTLSTQALELGAVFELMQNYLLIVDDVADQSALRRGQPTMQVLYKTAVVDATEHEANMAAVNSGLLAQHMASMVCSRIQEDPLHVLAAMQCMHRNIAVTGLGQIDDMYEQIGRDVQLQDLHRKHLLKTAYYTFINPLQSGLALAGVADTAGDAVAYGAPAGTAFQVHDDYLGIFGDGSQTGKANLDDIREGKYTYMVQYALEHAGADDVATLTRILGDRTATQTDLATVRNIFIQTGAVAANKTVESEEAEKAIQAARASQLWPKTFAESLVALVEYSVERNA